MSDRDNSAPGQPPYHETGALEWTERAFDLLDSGDLQARVWVCDKVVTTRLWGPCPRCGDFLDDQQTHTAVTNLFGNGESRLPTPWRRSVDLPTEIPVDVTCECGKVHTGAPGTARGCGVSFRVEVPLTDIPDDDAGTAP